MAGLRHAKSFEDLIVYQKADAITDHIFILSKSFPKEEMYSLTDQIRRSSRAIGAMISEAWAKRRYKNHFISKLTDGDAEQYETQHWINITLKCGYITAELAAQLKADLSEIGRMLQSMMDKAEAFCSTYTTIVREETATYYLSEEELHHED